MIEELKIILAKSPSEWTASERNLIIRANLQMGRQKVKTIRDDLQLVPKEDGVEVEKTHETLEDMALFSTTEAADPDDGV